MGIKPTCKEKDREKERGDLQQLQLLSSHSSAIQEMTCVSLRERAFMCVCYCSHGSCFSFSMSLKYSHEAVYDRSKAVFVC